MTYYDQKSDQILSDLQGVKLKSNRPLFSQRNIVPTPRIILMSKPYVLDKLDIIMFSVDLLACAGFSSIKLRTLTEPKLSSLEESDSSNLSFVV